MAFNVGFPALGDLQLTPDGRDVLLVSGAEKMRQNLRVRLQTFRGAWRYDRNVGMPYFQEILVFGASVELVRRRFRDAIAETDGIVSVGAIQVRFDSASGTIFVDFTCAIDSGEIIADTLDFKPAQS